MQHFMFSGDLLMNGETSGKIRPKNLPAAEKRSGFFVDTEEKLETGC